MLGSLPILPFHSPSLSSDCTTSLLIQAFHGKLFCMSVISIAEEIFTATLWTDVCLSHIQYCVASSSCLSTAPFSVLYSSAWLTGYEDPMIDKINQRIEDLTGLEMDTAEELQVKVTSLLLK